MMTMMTMQPPQPRSDFNQPPYYPKLPSICDTSDINIFEKNLNLTQKFLLENDIPKTTGELGKIKEIQTTEPTENIIFSEHLNKLLPKAEDGFNDELKSNENKIEMTSPNV